MMASNGLNSNVRVRRVEESVESNFNFQKIPWCARDKKTLLVVLKKYGYTDIENISREFPNRSKSSLKIMINKLRFAAEKCATKRENQIDVWLNSGFFNENDTTISQALKFISLFEKHPCSEKSMGCHFRTLYDILSKATHGIPPADPSQVTCETISYTLIQMTHEIWPACETDICEYIDNLQRDKMKNSYEPTKHS